MKLEMEPDLQRIEALKASVPKIDVYAESEGEINFPKIVTNPLTLLPSSEEMDWKFSTLMEKAEKILQRPRR